MAQKRFPEQGDGAGRMEVWSVGAVAETVLLSCAWRRIFSAAGDAPGRGSLVVQAQSSFRGKVLGNGGVGLLYGISGNGGGNEAL